MWMCTVFSGQDGDNNFGQTRPTCETKWSCPAITIPNSVTHIGNEAFHNCITLISLTVPNSVTSIGIYAFLNCYNLRSITLSNNLTSIVTFLYCVFCQYNAITSQRGRFTYAPFNIVSLDLRERRKFIYKDNDCQNAAN